MKRRQLGAQLKLHWMTLRVGSYGAADWAECSNVDSNWGSQFTKGTLPSGFLTATDQDASLDHKPASKPARTTSRVRLRLVLRLFEKAAGLYPPRATRLRIAYSLSCSVGWNLRMDRQPPDSCALALRFNHHGWTRRCSMRRPRERGRVAHASNFRTSRLSECGVGGVSANGGLACMQASRWHRFT